MFSIRCECLFALVHPVAAEVADPRDLLETTIETLRRNVIRDQMQITRDPNHVIKIVESVVLPHVGMRLASQLVLDVHWKEATPVQQDAFVDGLQHLLMRMFVGHVSNANVAYLPTEYRGNSADRAIVRTQVSREGVPKVAVNYRFHHSERSWKFYDIEIFGISLVKNYHMTLKGELCEHGLDGVIERINSGNPVPNGTATPSHGSVSAG
jgi:phospholipid transport system substrate-binding protein